MNFVFVSSKCLDINQHLFEKLHKKEIDILLITDLKYDNLNDDIKKCLKDYFYLEDLNDLEIIKTTISNILDKYKTIDYLNSNHKNINELLISLKSEYHLNFISDNNELAFYQKLEAKKLFDGADIKSVRTCLLDNDDNIKKFIDEVNYPIVIKPIKTNDFAKIYKIENDQALNELALDDKDEYIIEECLDGDLVSYVGMTNSSCEILYETSFVFPRNTLNIIKNDIDCFFWSIRNVPSSLKKIALKIIDSAKIKSSFFHIDFYILKEDKEGLAKKGDIIAANIELMSDNQNIINMINYASDIDIYDIYADMLKNDKLEVDTSEKDYYCVYASRSNNHKYHVPLDDINAIYRYDIISRVNNSLILNGLMGDEALIGRFENREDIWPFINAVVEENK